MSITIEGDMQQLLAAMQRQSLRRSDPKNAPPLKKPPKPFTGPDPKMTIPFAQYPHIVASVINYVDKSTLLALRAVCKETAKLVDREFAFHIEVSSDTMDLKITSRHLGRIPGLRFRGPISLGVSPIPNGVDLKDLKNDPRVVALLMKRMTVGAIGQDIWLRVPPATVPWLDEFMKHVVTVDMDGGSMATILPLSREQQVGKDPYGRVFVDEYPVQMIRMFPDNAGTMAHFVPFTARYLQHNCNMERPDLAADKTWIATSPSIPDGTEVFHLGVHVHPEIEIDSVAAQRVARPINFPASLKSVVVILAVHPAGAKPSLKSFMSLSCVFLKVFKNMPRDGTFKTYVVNVHLWDHIAGFNPRRRVLTLAALCHPEGEAMLADDKHPVWDKLADAIVFVRAEGNVIPFNSFEDTLVMPPDA